MQATRHPRADSAEPAPKQTEEIRLIELAPAGAAGPRPASGGQRPGALPSLLPGSVAGTDRGRARRIPQRREDAPLPRPGPLRSPVPGAGGLKPDPDAAAFSFFASTGPGAKPVARSTSGGGASPYAFHPPSIGRSPQAGSSSSSSSAISSTISATRSSRVTRPKSRAGGGLPRPGHPFRTRWLPPSRASRCRHHPPARNRARAG